MAMMLPSRPAKVVCKGLLYKVLYGMRSCCTCTELEDIEGYWCPIMRIINCQPYV